MQGLCADLVSVETRLCADLVSVETRLRADLVSPDLTTVQAGSGCVHFGPYDSIYIRPLVAVYGRIRPARTRPRLRLGLVLASRIHPYTAPRGLIYNTYTQASASVAALFCVQPSVLLASSPVT